MHVILASSGDLLDLPENGILADALRRRGASADVARWDDPSVDWTAPDAVVIRSTWDYAPRREEFVEWCRRVGSATRLWNPASVVEENTRKTYLRELAETGIPTVPTVWLDRGPAPDLSGLLEARGWSEAVIKPTVDAGARGLLRFSREDVGEAATHARRILAGGGAMVQPFLTDVVDRGEISLIFIAGAFRLAILKRAAAGEFRIQRQYGGSESVVDPTRHELDLARRVLEAQPGDLLYARVDLIRTRGAGPLLAELELTEPRLFLDHSPGTAEDLAQAVLDRLGSRPAPPRPDGGP